MSNKLKLGLVYVYNENWIGGTYYVQNLLASFNLLSREQRPEIVIFTNDKVLAYNELCEINDDLTYFNFELKVGPVVRIINKISNRLFSRAFFQKTYPSMLCDVVFPFDFVDSLTNIPIKINWVPDFQELVLPEYFNSNVLNNKIQFHNRIIKSKLPIIFSSKSVLNDFNKFYPFAQNKTFVLNFAVTLPEFKQIDISKLLDVYQINRPYFICSNQLWKHKNHLFLLQSIKEVVKFNDDILLIFTGKEHDYRNSEYVNEVKQFVIENNLTKNVKFLGFIERVNQLVLLKHSLAIIQPSLFEGWSTVVEDAKALQKAVIVSDIDTHIEQISENVIFFKRNDYLDLANIIINYKDNQIFISNNYSNKIEEFARSFLKIVHELQQYKSLTNAN